MCHKREEKYNFRQERAINIVFGSKCYVGRGITQFHFSSGSGNMKSSGLIRSIVFFRVVNRNLIFLKN